MWGRAGVSENLTETGVEGGWREVLLISLFSSRWHCVSFLKEYIYIYLLLFHSSVSFMSAPLAPWFIPLPSSCRPIPPRCSLFLFVFEMVDDALPVTAPLHHISHPLHEQDGEKEKAEKGGLRRIMRPG